MLRLPTDEALRIVDCRFSLNDKNKEERDYQVAHIPGASYGHLERDLSAPHRSGVTDRHPDPGSKRAERDLGSLGYGSKHGRGGPRVQVLATIPGYSMPGRIVLWFWGYGPPPRARVAHAGLPLPRLYPDSYGEWICDPALPVAHGE